MAFDKRYVPLETIEFSATEQSIDLDVGVPTTALRCRLVCSVTATGANNDATLNDDPLQRLISNIKIVWDKTKLVDNVALRDLYQFFLANTVQVPTQTEPAAADYNSGTATTAYELNFTIPFAWGFLRNPWDTHLPVLPVKRQLKMFVTWNTDNNGTGTNDDGTGAIITGGSDDYTWAVEPYLEVTQIEHPLATSARKPYFLPILSSEVSETWAAANSRFLFEVPDNRDFVMHILRNTYNNATALTNDVLEDAINTVSLFATGEDWLDEIPLDQLRAEEAEIFPAVNDETGYLRLLYASGGSLFKRINPDAHKKLKYAFDVEAPTAGTGLITVTSAQLIAAPPYTVADI